MIETKTEEEIALLRESCRIVRDCLAFVEAVSYTHLTLPTIRLL